jgi:hypothetical protein
VYVGPTATTAGDSELESHNSGKQSVVDLAAEGAELCSPSNGTTPPAPIMMTAAHQQPKAAPPVDPVADHQLDAAPQLDLCREYEAWEAADDAAEDRVPSFSFCPHALEASKELPVADTLQQPQMATTTMQQVQQQEGCTPPESNAADAAGVPEHGVPQPTAEDLLPMRQQALQQQALQQQALQQQALQQQALQQQALQQQAFPWIFSPPQPVLVQPGATGASAAAAVAAAAAEAAKAARAASSLQTTPWHGEFSRCSRPGHYGTRSCPSLSSESLTDLAVHGQSPSPISDCQSPNSAPDMCGFDFGYSNMLYVHGSSHSPACCRRSSITSRELLPASRSAPSSILSSSSGSSGSSTSSRAAMQQYVIDGNGRCTTVRASISRAASPVISSGKPKSPVPIASRVQQAALQLPSADHQQQILLLHPTAVDPTFAVDPNTAVTDQQLLHHMSHASGHLQVFSLPGRVSPTISLPNHQVAWQPLQVGAAVSRVQSLPANRTATMPQQSQQVQQQESPAAFYPCIRLSG